MKHPALLLPLATVCIAGGPAPVEDPLLEKTTVRMNVAAFLLRESGPDAEALPEFPTLGPLWRMSAELPDAIADVLPTQDGWGGAIFVRTLPDLLLVSPGPDGSLDLPYHDATRDEMLQDALHLLHDDIIVDGVGITTADNVLQIAQKRTIAHMRMIGVSIEVFAIEHGEYPGHTVDFVPVSVFEDDLSFALASGIPLVDAWGSPFLFWSDRREYCLISLAADGEPDHDYESLSGPPVEARGATAEPGDDIIYTDGGLVRWPEGIQT